MNLYPTYEEALAIAKKSDAKTLPVTTEILSDFTTPIETLRILRALSSQCFLLESAKADEEWGRYTFLGLNPKFALAVYEGYAEINGLKVASESPASLIRQLLQRYKGIKLEGMPPFCGGLVGSFSFDYFAGCEPAAKGASHDDSSCLARLMLFDQLICFDHVRQKLILIANMDLEHPESSYQKAVFELKSLKDMILHGKKSADLSGRLLESPKPLFEKEQFTEIVEKAKKHIYEGDIFQIVLSNALQAPFAGSLFETYRHLRTINPSPYMFYLCMDALECAGASPETLVRLENGILHTFPLAGTRPRGKTRQEDQALEAEVLADEKELAEHDMLVDLGRNDLGRISRLGSVRVEKLHEVQRYSHVMHIGSSVCSEIRDDLDALDAVASVLPAGTLSGAPKIRACQLIDELEDSPRSLYGGAVGYIDFSGNMDLCIAIRLLFKENGLLTIRSGAGIVADSDPEKEYEECLNKARSSLNALMAAMEDGHALDD